MKLVSRILKYGARSVTVLNLLLLGCILSLIWYALFPLFGAKVSVTVKAIPKTEAITEEDEEDEEQTPGISEYAMVSEQNLFHPERRIPPEKKVEKELPRPEIVLYGTVMAGDMSLAFIEDKKAPKTTPGRGKRQTVVKKGDNLGGFILKEIREAQIVLSRGEEIMTVNLEDATKVRSDEITRPPAPAPQTPAAGRAPAPTPTTPARTPAPAVTPPAPGSPAQGAAPAPRSTPSIGPRGQRVRQ